MRDSCLVVLAVVHWIRDWLAGVEQPTTHDWPISDRHRPRTAENLRSERVSYEGSSRRNPTFNVTW